MKKIEYIYREMLYQALEKQNRSMTQLGLANALKISISTVNHALKPLKKMNSITVSRRSLAVNDPKKILYYWASIRDLEKDIIYKTRVDMPVSQIEKNMPAGIIYGAYSAYKFRFKDAPSDYSEVYAYADMDDEGNKEIRKRFPETMNPPNLFIIKKDWPMEKYGKLTTTAQTFVDLWNIKTWYAKDFLKALEAKINERILE